MVGLIFVLRLYTCANGCMCCSNGCMCVFAAGLRRTAVTDGGRRQQWRGDESTAQPHRQQQRRQEGES